MTLIGPVGISVQEAQQRYDAGDFSFEDLRRLEEADLASRPAVERQDELTRGTVVIDHLGHAWEIGPSRASRTTPVDGRRVRSVVRVVTGTLITEFGPIKVIGDRAGYIYRTIKGRR